MGAKFKYNDGEIRREARNLDRKLENAVELIIDAGATRGEAYMKNNAPWTDRTGAARSGLTTMTHHESDQSTVVFAHAVDYGIWLEVKNDGEYEVIMPSVLHTGKEIMDDFRNLFERL
ncbi:hypothetical protein HWC82_gp21 [Gordonia phage Yikes]|uniref:Uncharacterized protein n=1 Tax=Gordonia phage Yikes TaxID=2656545 RepID=A0A649VF76_9CAUD|nr:hypothetical protein HWC82_gp21 [Gordonia phage Yikes]QGJ91010.1 hypothetical protein PBI_YIKES_21 [Gordonia phage Yikes]